MGIEGIEALMDRPTTNPNAAPPSGLMVVYLGCVDSVGHTYLVNCKNWPHLIPPDKCPWRQLDSKKSVPESREHGFALIRYKDGWTCLGINDNSVDTRPGSMSVFAVNMRDLGLNQILFCARSFPRYERILNRIGPITAITTLKED